MRGSQPIIKNIVIRQKKALPPPKGRQERAWKWVCSYGVIPEEVG